jgi:hypothetical protein
MGEEFQFHIGEIVYHKLRVSEKRTPFLVLSQIHTTTKDGVKHEYSLRMGIAENKEYNTPAITLEPQHTFLMEEIELER